MTDHLLFTTNNYFLDEESHDEIRFVALVLAEK